MSRRYNVLRNFVKIATMAAESEERFQETFKLLNSLVHQMEKMQMEKIPRQKAKAIVQKASYAPVIQS